MENVQQLALTASRLGPELNAPWTPRSLRECGSVARFATEHEMLDPPNW
jgi:hypothetical protein